MTRAEQQRIYRETGRRLPLKFADPERPCSALDQAGRCSVYQARPAVCRLFGSSEVLPCEHGCTPAGGLMPARNAAVVMLDVEQINKEQRR